MANGDYLGVVWLGIWVNPVMLQLVAVPVVPEKINKE